MPKYTFDLTVEIEAADIDEASMVLDDISGCANVTFVAPHDDNPEDYPDEA